MGRIVEEHDETLSELFKTLAAPLRIGILRTLLREPLTSVTRLSEVCGASHAAVSHELRSLRDNKSVSPTRDGKSVLYSLTDRGRLLMKCLELVKETL